MPVYVYRCQKCGDTFEENQKITDPALKQHGFTPEGACDGEVHRIIQPVGVTYNGSGFHCTDYGKTGRNAPSYKDYTS